MDQVALRILVTSGTFDKDSALAFAQSLPHATIVAMNGRCLRWDNVRKNKSSGAQPARCPSGECPRYAALRLTEALRATASIAATR